MKTKTLAMVYAATLVLTVGAGTAQASEASQEAQGTVRSVPVRYAPESLESEQGRQALREEIESAARRACGSFDIKDGDARRRFNRCYDKALADAVALVGSERVASVRE